MGETKESTATTTTTTTAAPSTAGNQEDLVLADGFSVVDSTTKSESNQGTTSETTPKSTSGTSVATVESKSEEKIKVEEEKKQHVETNNDDDEESKEDGGKVNGVDATLLITTEEDLELVDAGKKSDDIETTKPTAVEPKEESKQKDDSKEVKKKPGDVWVSNITRHVKATDLKKHFSRHGKVLTAKIVTNGKSFFGYILMESGDIANKSVKALNGSSLDGRKIAVSRQRPDQRRTAPSDRARTVKPQSRRPAATSETKKETSKHDDDKEKKSQQQQQQKQDSRDRDREALAASRRNEERLRRDGDYLRREVARLKRFLTDEQRRSRAEVQKTRNLQRELQEMEAKMREERRKFERERDIYEKNQRNDRAKMESDRTMMKKEMEEVKKLREYFKRKLEEEAARPVERRSARASSPYAYSSKRFREAPPSSKKYVAEERTRTPPSPPKLSRAKNRSPVVPFEKDRRSGHGHYGGGMDREVEGRHGSSLVVPSKPAAPAPPRNIWPSTFHQEVWRVPPSGPATSTPFPSSGGSGGGGQGSSSYRQSEYGGKSSSYSHQPREFGGKRDHYNSGSVRKY